MDSFKKARITLDLFGQQFKVLLCMKKVVLYGYIRSKIHRAKHNLNLFITSSCNSLKKTNAIDGSNDKKVEIEAAMFAMPTSVIDDTIREK